MEIKNKYFIGEIVESKHHSDPYFGRITKIYIEISTGCSSLLGKTYISYEVKSGSKDVKISEDMILHTLNKFDVEALTSEFSSLIKSSFIK